MFSVQMLQIPLTANKIKLKLQKKNNTHNRYSYNFKRIVVLTMIIEKIIITFILLNIILR